MPRRGAHRDFLVSIRRRQVRGGGKGRLGIANAVSDVLDQPGRTESHITRKHERGLW
jgi:hypothetical protein